MNSYLNDLNLIDLLSEKHAKCRKVVRNEWAKNTGENINDTESYILALLERKNMTSSELAKIIDISRQGVHKATKNLITKEYIEIESDNYSLKNKKLKLTHKGLLFQQETLKLKNKIEKQIIDLIGEEKIETLKLCLQEEWF